MAKVKEKREAIRLRRKGKSIKEIASSLKVSPGSVSIWCQDVVLTPRQAEQLKIRQIQAGHIGRQIGANKNREKRIEVVENHKLKALAEIGTLSQRDIFLLGIGLYWGEGVKSRSGMAALVNSDPDVIKFGKIWFQKCLGVSEKSFSPYVYISEGHKKRRNKITNFWSKETGISRERFKVIILKTKPKKRYANHNSYYGVLSLRVSKSTDLKYRIKGLINACRQAGN